jgi:glycosyltransferase involved in cell wall biosynthesis
MKFSIIICSRNRASDLKGTLEAFVQQTRLEEIPYEIIAVDNDSVDKTKETVEGLIPRFQGRLRYIHESRIGIPFARNRGIKESLGEVIVFVDDDCLPREDYIYNLNKIFNKLENGVGFVGGRIDPLFDPGVNIPQWLHDDPFFWGPLAVLNYGPAPFNIGHEQLKTKDRLFFSANMAVKKELFNRYGGITENKLLTGDTDLCLRLIFNGILGRYEPELIVRHKIEQQRLAPETYRRWFYQRGKYRDLTFPHEPRFYHPFGIPIWLLRKAFHQYKHSLKATTFGKKLRHQCDYSFTCGQIVKIFKKIGRVNNQFLKEISAEDLKPK